jgi:hypothetical protein
MNRRPLQQVPSHSPSHGTVFSVLPPRPVFLTVDQFSKRNPAFTPPALRNLIFKAVPRESSKGEIPGNGLIEAGAILRVGRKVLIDEDRFFEWVRGQNGLRQELVSNAPRIKVESSTPSTLLHSRRSQESVCENCNGAGMDPNTSEECGRCRGTSHEPRDE